MVMQVALNVLREVPHSIVSLDLPTIRGLCISEHAYRVSRATTRDKCAKWTLGNAHS